MTNTFPGRVEGKVALVTGAASGLGEAVAHLLAQHGAKVYVADISATDAVERAIADAGGRAAGLSLDVTSEPAWEAAMRRVRADDGRLDILVNNAGVGAMSFEGTEGVALADFEAIQRVNVAGVFLGTKHAVRLMKLNSPPTPGGASIVNMSSAAGLKGSPVLVPYCASKGAVRLLTKASALDVAHRKYAIRINSVHPGYVPPAPTPLACATTPHVVPGALSNVH